MRLLAFDMTADSITSDKSSLAPGINDFATALFQLADARLLAKTSDEGFTADLGVFRSTAR